VKDIYCKKKERKKKERKKKEGRQVTD